MNSDAKRMGEVILPEGKMVVYGSANGDPYPGIEIILVTNDGKSILSRTEFDSATKELKVIAYSPSAEVDSPISITTIDKDGDWRCQDMAF